MSGYVNCTDISQSELNTSSNGEWPHSAYDT